MAGLGVKWLIQLNPTLHLASPSDTSVSYEGTTAHSDNRQKRWAVMFIWKSRGEVWLSPEAAVKSAQLSRGHKRKYTKLKNTGSCVLARWAASSILLRLPAAPRALASSHWWTFLTSAACRARKKPQPQTSPVRAAARSESWLIHQPSTGSGLSEGRADVNKTDACLFCCCFFRFTVIFHQTDNQSHSMQPISLGGICDGADLFWALSHPVQLR